jgi:hypothetical protein
MKKILKRVVLVLLLFIAFINIPLLQINHQSSLNDYSNWMSETLPQDISLTDIHMLGAHDAFSKDINLFSETDISAPSVMTGIPGTLLKGFLVRQSKTQVADAKELLESGVRYFDVRLTYNEGTWVTKHNYVSTNFLEITNQINEFIQNNNGEIIILDFQHINGIDYTSNEDYLLFTEMLEDSGLLENSYYNTVNSLHETTYEVVTEQGAKTKLIIIDKFQNDERITYDYESSIRSNWANDDDFEGVIAFLEEEAQICKEDSNTSNTFRVMQAVTTMQMSKEGIINSFQTWSLIERAEDFNTYLINNQHFDEIFETLPIMMVDYSNTNQDDFLDKAMEKVIEYNTK